MYCVVFYSLITIAKSVTLCSRENQNTVSKSHQHGKLTALDCYKAKPVAINIQSPVGTWQCFWLDR